MYESCPMMCLTKEKKWFNCVAKCKSRSAGESSESPITGVWLSVVHHTEKAQQFQNLHLPLFGVMYRFVVVERKKRKYLFCREAEVSSITTWK